VNASDLVLFETLIKIHWKFCIRRFLSCLFHRIKSLC